VQLQADDWSPTQRRRLRRKLAHPTGRIPGAQPGLKGCRKEGVTSGREPRPRIGGHDRSGPSP
jgi:hypothetical protein